MDALTEAAAAVRDRAYAPYSGFRVGAALEVADGRVFVGANVENASYGLTICAERAAVAAAVAGGATHVRRVVIVTDAATPVAPCGACRQVLSEFGRDIVVKSVAREGSAQWKIGELLPNAFSADDING